MRTLMAFLSMLCGLIAIALVLDSMVSISQSKVTPGLQQLPPLTPMMCMLLPEPDGMVLDCYLPLNETPPPQEDGNFQRWPSPPAQMKPFKSA